MIPHRRAFCLCRALAVTGLAACLAAIAHEALASNLPTDPFRRTAIRALRGDFGPLTAWQREGYSRGLKSGVTAAKWLHVTGYDPKSCPGTRGASGERVSLRMAASNTIPQRAFIWTEKYGIRQVLDTGSRRNDAKADAAGCNHWVDYFFWSHAQALRVGRTKMRGAVIP